MRPALAAALLVVCLCGQGCLSFFYLGSKPPPGGEDRTASCIATGLWSSAFLALGTAMMVQGIRDSTKISAAVDGMDQSIADTGILTAMGGFLLEIPGIVLGIVSISHGSKHGRPLRIPQRGSRPRTWREARRASGTTPSPHGRWGGVIVGLPRLEHIDPRKLPIQRVNWYWPQEE
ncbi:MAG: hypothetical protein ACYS47_10900 [Planctomycetota bacterium]|jgi:hypothetical protein